MPIIVVLIIIAIVFLLKRRNPKIIRSKHSDYGLTVVQHQISRDDELFNELKMADDMDIHSRIVVYEKISSIQNSKASEYAKEEVQCTWDNASMYVTIKTDSKYIKPSIRLKWHKPFNAESIATE